jgi:hypothetical protein
LDQSGSLEQEESSAGVIQKVCHTQQQAAILFTLKKIGFERFVRFWETTLSTHLAKDWHCQRPDFLRRKKRLYDPNVNNSPLSDDVDLVFCW